MKLEIFAKDIKVTPELKKYIEEKVRSFDNILGKSKEERFCDFRVGRNAKSHSHGQIYFAEARVETPHKNYGAKAKAETLEAAIDELKDEILKKIRRNKDKKDSMVKRGGRKLKELLKKNK